MSRRDFRAVVVGGGPAGVAPFVAASREGRLQSLLNMGIAIVERGAAIGAGNLGSYAVMSDSTAATFLTAVEQHLDPRVGSLKHSGPYRALQQLGRSCAKVELASDLMASVGRVMASAVTDAGGELFCGHEAISARRHDDGTWRLSIRPDGGSPFEITCEYLVLATGGHQSRDRLLTEPFGGAPLLPRHGDRLLLSDDVLRRGGVDLVRRRIANLAAPRLAIAGASTSALAVANLLLEALSDRFRSPGSIRILHRRPPRIFYTSAEDARADRYDDFGPEDICPVSGFVYRLAGFREDARALAMGMLGIGGRAPEHRAQFQSIVEGGSEATQATLDEADVVIAALGYRPNLLTLFDRDGCRMPLAGHHGEPAVDKHCRVVAVGGEPVAEVLGIGLAAGFSPIGRFGGEPSFTGQANGLWLWQNNVGSAIVDTILDEVTPAG